MTGIHPTALVDPGAELDSSVTVGPYTVIGAHVKVDAGTTIGAHCVIEGHTTIGQDNRIFQFNSLGAIPQDKKYAGEPCELVIGHRNTIREFCTLNIGSPGDTGVTRVGDDNWIMAYVHLAHDCVVGNHTIFANNSQLAGHVHVDDWVILGGFTVVHQFVRLGAHSMTAMCSLLFADLPPFVMCQGQPAACAGAVFLPSASRRSRPCTRPCTEISSRSRMPRAGLPPWCKATPTPRQTLKACSTFWARCPLSAVLFADLDAR